MREVVEIGIGREARRTYQLSEVSIVPSRRTRTAREVDISWKLDAYEFDTPVVGYPTDALGSPEFIIRLNELGGLGVFNAEGLWGRHSNVPELIEEITELSFNDIDPNAAVRRLQELHAAPIKEELLTEAIKQIRDSGATTAVRVSPENAEELAPIILAAGADILVVQGTLISAEHVSCQDRKPLDLREFIGNLDIPVIAGGVVDYKTALHLMRTGAAGVIVGYGSHEGITTTGEVLGINVEMASAIADAAAARRDYLDETGGRYVHVLAAGDIETSGDIAKSVACGADAVILGAPLAAAREAPGRGWFWPTVTAHPASPRGAVAPVFNDVDDEGNPIHSLETVLQGPTSDPTGTLNLMGGLRHSMAKCGYSDLKEFQRVSLSVHW